MINERVGYYCWAGPGTKRMLQLKYFHPNMDEHSLFSSYEPHYLERIKETFGVTDFWATYSWGFSDETEQLDRQYLIYRISYFKEHDIRLHAYIQGPNVVYKDFEEKDWFCKNEKGKLIPYHRGRKLVCLNSPGYQEFMLHKIQEACQYDFDGIFIDNIQMGMLGIPRTENKPFAFVGCRCEYCQTQFTQLTGYEIPTNIHKCDRHIRDAYLTFRETSTNRFIALMAEEVKKHDKLFGTNSFDPQFDTRFVYGTDLQVLHDVQDYLLFENHSLPTLPHVANNVVIQMLRMKYRIEKPVFVVSYKEGIGFDGAYSQQDLNNVFTEATMLNYAPCIKGSEYVTDKVWHNLDVDHYDTPKILDEFPLTPVQRNAYVKRVLFSLPFVRYFMRVFTNRLLTNYWESATWRKIFNFFYKDIVK